MGKGYKGRWRWIWEVGWVMKSEVIEEEKGSTWSSVPMVVPLLVAPSIRSTMDFIMKLVVLRSRG